MISLHAVKPAVPRSLARAAAMLHRDYNGISRFRLTGLEVTERYNDYTAPLQYYYAMRWDDWSNHSLENYRSGSRYHRDPTEEEIDAAYAMFEEKT